MGFAKTYTLGLAMSIHCLVLFGLPSRVSSDTFASIASLKTLVKHRTEMIESFETFITREEEILHEIKQ